MHQGKVGGTETARLVSTFMGPVANTDRHVLPFWNRVKEIAGNLQGEPNLTAGGLARTACTIADRFRPARVALYAARAGTQAGAAMALTQASFSCVGLLLLPPLGLATVACIPVSTGAAAVIGATIGAAHGVVDKEPSLYFMGLPVPRLNKSSSS